MAEKEKLKSELGSAAKKKKYGVPTNGHHRGDGDVETE